jgi:hypothetical protein
MPKTSSASNTNAPTKFLTAGNEKYAYRRFGSGHNRHCSACSTSPARSTTGTLP